ncbi:MAG: imidazole glycerol phosphate synthase subunit HisF [Candidatus Lokiarchaeota archaeon]|nr:imidazole glycerol phosphate synthase subunit HisF [Candidatus Lokiarchaeota archaeon]
MTLAKRVIPCLDVDHGRVVKGINFVDLRGAGDPVELAIRYRDNGADELVFLDITASVESRQILGETVTAVASEIDIPFTVGGGLRNLDDIRSILKSGADKVTLNTAAVKDPNLIGAVARVFGSQCVVVAIDAKRLAPADRDVEKNRQPAAEVYIHGGREATGMNCIEWAKRVERLGAGEILLTSMDRDGTKEGYDLELTKAIVDSVGIPVIASGGAGEPNHFLSVLREANADAALAASVFHFSSYPIPVIKEYLHENGVVIRI